MPTRFGNKPTVPSSVTVVHRAHECASVSTGRRNVVPSTGHSGSTEQMRPIPDSLRHGPFTVSQAANFGVTRRMLMGGRFRQLHRGVHVVADHLMSSNDWLAAARLAMPADARLSHISRIQALGLDYGPTEPVHFTVPRDLHLTQLDRSIFLHRTEVLPPCDDIGVRPAAAFIQYLTNHSLLDAIRVGDWLLHNDHMSVDELRQLAHAQGWRPGAAQVESVAIWLNGRAASLPESSCRVYLTAAGLPTPQVNVPVLNSPNSPVSDLWIPEYRLAIEHEGGHHFRDASQIKRDIWRYGVMRESDAAYVQVFDDVLRHPRAYVYLVHQQLVHRGYEGPRPTFGTRWRMLHARPRALPTA